MLDRIVVIIRYFLQPLLYLLFISTTFAQQDTLWTRTFGGNDEDRRSDVQQTSDDGYIIIGGTYSYGAGEGDLWLIKTDAYGDTVWTKTYGGSDWDEGRYVQQTSDGGYILAGGTRSYGAGLGDIWLIKTNASGDTVWTKTYGGSERDWSYSVQQTTDGGFIITGETRSFGNGPGDVWLIKTDVIGDTLWTRTFGDSSDDRGNSVRQTSDGGYIITGDTQSYGAGWDDVWLIKTDTSGDTLWTKTFGGSESDRGNSVRQTSDGGYIIAGITYSFGPGISAVWLIKTDTSGDILWTRTFGGSDTDRGNSVRQTNDGGYIIVGTTQSYGPGLSAVWLIKTDATGDTLWTRTFGGSSYDIGNSVRQTSDGGYIIAGDTQSYGVGYRDIWLIRIESDTNRIRYVSTSGSDSTGDGSESNPLATIQAGIDASIDGDTVLVQPGIYVENINFNGKNIVVGSFTLITGDTSYISQTVIDGDSNGSVVTIENCNDSTKLKLFGFTIINGLASEGGGIYCIYSNLTLMYLTVRGNTATQNGGGIYCGGSTMNLENVNIENCVSDGNGGGLYFAGSGGEFTHVTITNNLSVQSLGAGIYCMFSNPLIRNTVISNNSSPSWHGAGIAIVENSAPILVNVTVTGNSAESGGGGILCNRSSHPVLLNTIVWGNQPQEIELYDINPECWISISHSDVSGGETGIITNNNTLYWLEGNIDADPLFVDSTNGDFQLQPGSPCIDAGIAFFVWEGDTLINMSPDEYAGSAPDIGALGVDSSFIVPVVINEIMYDPAAAEDGNGEWFELYNPNPMYVDLEGWIIKDADTDFHIINQQVIIPPAGFLVFGIDSNMFYNGDVIVNYQYDETYLVNAIDELILVNPYNVTVDSVCWDNGLTFPAVNGASIKLIDANLDNSIGSNWTESITPFGAGDCGTPGASNYIPQISVDPLFSFDTVAVGDTTIRELQIINVGAATLNVHSIYTIRDIFLPLSINATIESQDTDAIEVSFAPIEIREYTDTLFIVSDAYNNPLVLVELFGLGGDSTLSVRDELSLPTAFALHQNYPNPFNPVTTIRYDLPEQSRVTITIYDLLGRQVKTLINRTQDAGFKSIQWNASTVPSGMYFYQISAGSLGKAGNFTQTRKIVLLTIP